MDRPIDIPYVDRDDTNSVAPSVAVQESGYSADDILPASWLNHTQGRTAQWLVYLARQACKQILGAQTLVGTGNSWAVWYNEREQRWMVLDDAGDIYETSSGRRWRSIGGAGGPNPGAALASNHPHALNSSNSEVVIARDEPTTILTTSGVQRAIAAKAVTAATSAVAWDGTNSLFLAAATGGQVLSMATIAGAVTVTATGASGDLTDIVTNGSGLTVVVSDDGEVYWSSNGTSWTSATAAFAAAYTGTPPTSSRYLVTYDPSEGLFFVSCSDGLAVLSSPNGIAWTERDNAGASTHDILGLHVVADGMLGRLSRKQVTPNGGVATDELRYETSEDLGVTWQEQWSDFANGSAVATLSAVRNKQAVIMVDNTTNLVASVTPKCG